MDYTLSFHIGLITRVMANQAKKAPDRPEPRLERTRRQWEQAPEAGERAKEAEDFQAIGVRCRETLVSFAHALGDESIVPEGETPPKGSDFVHWSERIADALAPGASNSELRSYLKALAKAAWNYVSWLTHAKNAVRFDSDLSIEIVGHVLSLFEQALARQELGVPERCPECGSYQLAHDSELSHESETITHRIICEACGWRIEREPEPFLASVPLLPPEGDCTPSSSGPGRVKARQWRARQKK
jgi:predicted RNA-binding Zn-ribbon protein involved in translation (DUF1610 family)